MTPLSCNPRSIFQSTTWIGLPRRPAGLRARSCRLRSPDWNPYPGESKIEATRGSEARYLENQITKCPSHTEVSAETADSHGDFLAKRRRKRSKERSTKTDSHLSPIKRREPGDVENGEEQKRIWQERAPGRNSACRPIYRIGFDRRFSAFFCQILRYCSGRPAASRDRPNPRPGSSSQLRREERLPHVRYIGSPEVRANPIAIPPKISK